VTEGSTNDEVLHQTDDVLATTHHALTKA